jgi:hypothetical protein
MKNKVRHRWLAELIKKSNENYKQDTMMTVKSTETTPGVNIKY